LFVVFFSVSFSSVVSCRDGHSVGRSSVGYRLNEHFHMKNQEAMTTTSIDMTKGLLSDDDDWPCCIAAGCSPDEQENNKGNILIYDCSLSVYNNGRRQKDNDDVAAYCLNDFKI
jgi:hypothetical protein